MENRTVRTWGIAAAVALAAALVACLSGCAMGDFVRSAQGSFGKALRVEDPAVFFEAVLARALGQPPPPPPPWQARQHYLTVIYNLEGISAEDENSLKREGLLGEAFVLKTLAQWRLGRIADARASALRARASGQEALDARHRALFRAFEGIARLDAALDAVAAGKPYPEVAAVVAGDTGAWRLLGGARTEIDRGAPLQNELIQTRLAAFKALRDARARDPEASARDPSAEWDRLRAEAQVELAELEALPADDPAARAERVRTWQRLTGLAPPATGR